MIDKKRFLHIKNKDNCEIYIDIDWIVKIIELDGETRVYTRNDEEYTLKATADEVLLGITDMLCNNQVWTRPVELKGMRY